MDTAMQETLDEYIAKLQKLRKAAYPGRIDPRNKAGSNLQALAVKSTNGFLAHCALVRTLRRNVRALAEPGCVAVFSVPATWQVSEIIPILKELYNEDKQMKLCGHPSGKHKRGWEIEASDFLKAKRLIIVASEGSEIHEDFELAVTVRDNVELSDVRHLHALSHLRECGELTIEQATLIARQPSERMEAIFRFGQPAGRAASRLSAENKTVEFGGTNQKVDLSIGFGEAALWASELRKDLDDWRNGNLQWSEVDKGCLLHGPTGTGKTRFAAALASACDLHLEAASIAKWQGYKDGALGDMLQAMYKAFASAKANAPALLFIDEVDSIGDRNKFPSRHANYSTQVVNALLECLDGIEGRDGVIVIGACNFPDRIDPAILRSGRLEKHILFPLPDADGRAAILAHYLPSLVSEPALKTVAARLPGKSGADLERLAREARRIARREKRSIEIGDVLSRIEPFPLLKEADLYRIAIHEAAHAMVAHVLRIGKVRRVEVFDNIRTFATELDAHGITELEPRKSPFETLREKRDLIAMHLAGAAAEEFLCQDRSTLSVGAKHSDFEAATLVAIRMVSHQGFGTTPYFIPGSVDIHSAPGLWKDERLEVEVNEILQAEFKRADEILRGLQNPLLRFAARLMKQKRLEGKDLEGLWPGAIYTGATSRTT